MDRRASKIVRKELCFLRRSVQKSEKESDVILSWLYTYYFLHFDMFVHYFVNYFVRLRTSHYTLFTISPTSFIFDSARNLPYRPLWRFMKIPIAWRELRNTRWEKWLARRFTKCHLYTSRFSSILKEQILFLLPSGPFLREYQKASIHLSINENLYLWYIC